MTMESKPHRSSHFKKALYHQLFKQASQPEQHNQFLQLYLKGKQDSRNQDIPGVSSLPRQVLRKAHNGQLDPSKQLKAGQDQAGNNQSRKAGHPTLEINRNTEGKIRPSTCSKYQEITSSPKAKRGSKHKISIKAYAKALEKKDSGSKKSTDASLNDQREQLALQNKQFEENLKHEQNKIRRLSKAIDDQRKIQEIQIFLYEKSIESLRKKASLTQGDNQEALDLELVQQLMNNNHFDSLQIESD